jgi:hypothetical protein
MHAGNPRSCTTILQNAIGVFAESTALRCDAGLKGKTPAALSELSIFAA